MAYVKVLRTDFRLIHGQVAMSWLNIINPHAIVIANDALVNDEIGKMAAKMAKPQGMKMSVRTVEDAVALVNNPKTDGTDLFVVAKNLRDTVRFVELVGADKVGTVNIGGAQKKKDGKQLYKGVILDADDIECVRELIKLVGNKKIDSRTIPSDALQDLESILNKL